MEREATNMVSGEQSTGIAEKQDGATEVTSVKVVRNYKDTVFRMVFRERSKLLELYNAINDTHYANPEELEIWTLENAVYLSMKNDVSCLLDMRLQLYEQQSTVNPNMPIRNLMYVSRQYEKLLVNKDVHVNRLIKLPTPKFIVFYNGAAKQPERREFRLSEAFQVPVEEPALELVVVQLNINEGYNHSLLEKCPTLWQYMVYVNRVREHQKSMSLEQAVQCAVEECIRDNILRKFLLENKAEVSSMSILEYDEEKFKRAMREDGYLDGFEDGKMANLISLICRKMAKGKTPEVIIEELEEDADTVRNICREAGKYAPEYDVRKVTDILLAHRTSDEK